MPEILTSNQMLPNRFEPKTKNRFVFQIEGVDAFLIKTSNRPGGTYEEKEHHWINSRRYLKGKFAPIALSLTLHDPIAPSAMQQVQEWARTHHDPASGRDGYADFYKRDVMCKLLDPVGTVIELWDIKGAFVTEWNGGDLDYAAGDLLEISLTLRYDAAFLIF